MRPKHLLASLAVGLVVLTGSAACGTPAPNEPTILSSPAPPVSDAPTAQGVSPVAIRIPALKLETSDFTPGGLGLDKNHALAVPPYSKPKQIAWFNKSPVPGDKASCDYTKGCVQSAVMSSHVNANGVDGGFVKIAQLKKGQIVETDRSDGKIAVFEVYKLVILKKKAFPTDSVYGPTPNGEAELRLITCGPGPLERMPDGSMSYINQTIGYAKFISFKEM